MRNAPLPGFDHAPAKPGTCHLSARMAAALALCVGGCSTASSGGGPGACPPTVTVHRPAASGTCAPELPAPAGGAPACTTFADCTDAGLSGCFSGQCAVDQCLSDTDCPGRAVCMCGHGAFPNSGAAIPNTCTAEDCRTDADCGPGGFCSPSLDGIWIHSGGATQTISYHCHAPADECSNDCECGGLDSSTGTVCAYQPTAGHWACTKPSFSAG